MSTRVPEHKALCIKDIFATGEKYQVPAYQRGFAWTEEEVGQLLTDLDSSFSEQPDEFYLLGQAIVCRGESSWEVVDGQQRLTTLFLFLAAAEFGLKDDVGNWPYSQNQRFTLVASMLRNIDDGDEGEPRLLVAKSGRSLIREIIRGNRIDDLPLTDYTQQNIHSAFRQISDWLTENYPDLLSRFNFLWHVLTKVVIVRLELDNTHQALRVFQKMNNRGLVLDDADLLKNLLFIKATEDEFKILSATWDSASQTLYKSKLKRVRSMEFLMKALIGIETGKSIKSSDVFDEWESRLEDNAKAQDFAHSLTEKASSLMQATHNKSSTGEAITETPGTSTFKWVQHLEVLLAGRHLDIDSYRNLCEIVDSRAMLSMFAGEKNQDFERMVHKWAQRISGLNESATRSEILEASQAATDGLETLLTSAKEGLGRLSYGVKTHRAKMRFALGVVAQELELLANNRGPNNELVSKVTTQPKRGEKRFQLDHIFPQAARQREFFDDQSRSELIHSIGNLVLLHPQDNQEQGDELPSSLEKKTNIAGSQLIVNKILFSEGELGPLPDRVRQVHGAMRKKQPVNFGNWGSKDILRRQEIYGEILADSFKNRLT